MPRTSIFILTELAEVAPMAINPNACPRPYNALEHQYCSINIPRIFQASSITLLRRVVVYRAPTFRHCQRWYLNESSIFHSCFDILSARIWKLTNESLRTSLPEYWPQDLLYTWQSQPLFTLGKIGEWPPFFASRFFQVVRLSRCILYGDTIRPLDHFTWCFISASNQWSSANKAKPPVAKALTMSPEFFHASISHNKFLLKLFSGSVCLRVERLPGEHHCPPWFELRRWSRHQCQPWYVSAPAGNKSAGTLVGCNRAGDQRYGKASRQESLGITSRVFFMCAWATSSSRPSTPALTRYWARLW